MLNVTSAAVFRLKALMLEHPDDPVVRVSLTDLDDARLAIRITLEDVIHPDDQVQDIEGLTVVVAAANAPRMNGVTLDYTEPGGFRFIHPEPPDEFNLDLFDLN
jgi:Fe-S cluster assembly iron-binding protein IscA